MENLTHATPGRYCQLFDIPEVTDLEVGVDFRLPQYRREVFLRFYEFHLKYRAHPGGVYMLFPYLADLARMDQEQKLWFAFINGNTQNPVTTWMIYNKFPSLRDLKMDDLEYWFNEEYARLEFDTDRRHHKSHFLRSVDCYRRLTGVPYQSQVDYFHKHSDPSGFARFRRLWNTVMERFHSFGRLSTFSYLEYLRIMGLDLQCDNLFLEDMEGSKSHRNGLAKVLGRDDLDWHDSNPTNFNGKYTKEVLDWLKKEAENLLFDARERMDGRDFYQDIGYFTLESTFCTFKSWFRKGRRYPGVYMDMLHGRISKAQERWPGLSASGFFQPFWDARKLYLPDYLRLEDNPRDPGVKPSKQNHFRDTGEVIMMHHEWPCFENAFNREVEGAA